MFRILYRLIADLARLAVRSGRSKDPEVIVLRHQLGGIDPAPERSHIPTRQMFFAGVTANPTGAWTTQAARNLFLHHAEQLEVLERCFEIEAANSSTPSTRPSAPIFLRDEMCGPAMVLRSPGCDDRGGRFSSP